MREEIREPRTAEEATALLEAEALARIEKAEAAAEGSGPQEAYLLGGPFNGHRVQLAKTPPRISAGGFVYERIDDPDSGEYLGAYAVPYSGGFGS